MSPSTLYEVRDGIAWLTGLVNQIASGPELAEAAQKMVLTIAANAPLSVRAGEAMVYATAELTRTQAWEEAERLYRRAYLTEDALEGPKAFREKRKPQWRGR